MDLLGDSDDDGGEVKFNVNKSYAMNYEVWRGKEEKQKLIDKYGEGDDSSSSSEEEEIRSTSQMDKDWLRAYAVVRFQQPRLYKEGEHFFHDKAMPVVKKKEKKNTLKDHERKFILEKGGVESDEDDQSMAEGKSYFEEQDDIKKSFKDVLGESSSDDDDELLVKQQKTKEQHTKEENEYLEWLRGEREELEDKEAAAELAPLKAYWNDPNLSEKEKVLRDYVFNNGYMDQEESDESDSDSGPDHNEEEQFLEVAEQFEQKYNFRHEEPGGDEIKSYPRTIETSVRTKDTRRVEQRQRRMEKKRSDKFQKQDEIRLLQKLQKEERQQKLKKLQYVAQNSQLDYNLDADFDPSEHDKLMQKFFGSDYYGDDHADEKPKFEFDAALDEEEDDWWHKRLKEDEIAGDDDSGPMEATEDGDQYGHNDDEQVNFNMDADYDPEEDHREKGKNKKKMEKKKIIKKLPLFDPTMKTFDEYIHEYLKDKIGTLPFTYREVEPNDYGLTTTEILQAKENELNTWVSLKKISEYRSKHEELAHKRKYNARIKIPGKKYKTMPSLFAKPKLSEDGTAAKKKGKKNRTEHDIEACKSLGDQESQDSDVSVNDAGTVDLSDDDTVKLSHGSVKDKHTDSSILQTNSKRKLTASDSSSPDKKKKKKPKESLLNVTNSEGEHAVKKKKDKKVGKSRALDSTKNVPTKQMLKKKTKANGVSIYTNKSESEREKSIAKTSAASLQEHSDAPSPKKRVKSEPKKNKEKPEVPNIEKSSDSGKIASSLVSKPELAQKKKKKVSIRNFNKKEKSMQGGNTVSGMDRKRLQFKLSQVMSAGRLSKFGIGPDAAKTLKKKKNKKQTSQ